MSHSEGLKMMVVDVSSSPNTPVGESTRRHKHNHAGSHGRSSSDVQYCRHHSRPTLRAPVDSVHNRFVSMLIVFSIFCVTISSCYTVSPSSSPVSSQPSSSSSLPFPSSSPSSLSSSSSSSSSPSLPSIPSLTSAPIETPIAAS